MNYSALKGEKPPKNPDLKAYKEQELYENAVTKRYRQDTKFRRSLTKWAKNVVSIYLLIVFIIISLNNSFFELSDTVLSVLLGTTTVNVLGLMYIVLKGYFNQEEKK